MDLKIQNIVAVVLVIVIGFLYQAWDSASTQNKLLNNQLSDTKEQLATANTTIEHLNTESIRINKLNEANSRKIQSLINNSAKELEGVKNAIKGIECTSVNIPDDAINILLEQANRIRQQANTEQLNSSEPATVTE